MRYLDSHCKYVESLDAGNHIYTFTGPCISCKKDISVNVPGPELYRYRQGDYIQDALTSVNADGREFLMSGICGQCFDKAFAESD